MQKKYFVIDSGGNISWNAKKDAPEYFNSRGIAFRRAQELAETEPGKLVHVAETCEIVI